VYMPIHRVHSAYQKVRSGRAPSRFLSRMHALYTAACTTEFVSAADAVLVETIEAETKDGPQWNLTSVNAKQSNAALI
jgi:hypothetical protein